MKTLLLLVIGLGFAAAIISEPSYRPNTAYIYDYDVQVLSGFPETSKTTAGLVLNTKVKIITKENPENIIVKLENVRLWHLMKELPRLPTVETYLPIEDFVPMEPEKFIAMERELTKPFIAKRENGIIVMVQVAADAPEWAVNIKKALLNTINVDLMKTTINEVNFRREPLGSEVFETMERTLFGECSPMYSIVPEAIESSEPILKVTKIVDLLKCKNRPVFMENIMESYLCKECAESQLDFITNNMLYKYEIIGQRHDFIIKKVDMTATHVLAPMRPEHGTISQFIKAKLVLIREEAAEPESLTIPELKVCPEVLRMVVEEHEIEKPPIMARRLRTELVRELVEKIKAIIGVPTEERPKAILELIPILKEASVEDLKVLIEELLEAPSSIEYWSEEKKILKRLVVIDILPYVRTHEAVFVLKSLIANLGRPECMLTHFEIAEILTMLSLGAKPSKFVVKEIHEIAEMIPVSTNIMTRKAAWLAYANILKRLLNEPIRREISTVHPIMNDLAFINRHITIVSGRWSLARTEEEKLLAVKIMSIIPLPQLIPKIVTIVKDANLPMILRVEAIKAMEIHAIFKPAQVIETCMPILFERCMPEEVRIIAFKSIIMAKPKATTLHHIAAFINEEPNKHITSYCYSYLATISKVKLPCIRKWASQVRYVLKTIKPAAFGIQYSKAAIISVYSELLRQGIIHETGMITTPKSFLPKTFHAKTGIYSFGRYMNLLEITAFTEGVPALIEKMIGSAGSWKNSDSIFDMVRRRVPRSAERAIPAREAINRLMSQWRYESEEPKIAIFTKLFGHEMPYLDISEEFLQNLKTDGRFHIEDIDNYLREGIPLKFQRSMIVERLERVIPTMVGLPLKLKIQSAVSVKVDGSAKIIVEPRLFRNERSSRIPEEVNVEIDATPKVATYSKMAVDLEIPVIKIGSKAKIISKTAIPIYANVKAIPRTMKIEAEVKPIPANAEVIKMKVIPESILRVLPEPVHMLSSLPEREMFKKIKICRTASELIHAEIKELKSTSCPVTKIMANLEAIWKYERPVRVASMWQGPLPPFTPIEIVLKARPETRIEKIIAKAAYTHVEPHSEENDWPLITRLPRVVPYKKIQLDVNEIKMGVEREVLISKVFFAYAEEEMKWIGDVHIKMPRLVRGSEMTICIGGESMVPRVPEFYTRPLPRHVMTWPIKIAFNFGKCHEGKPALIATITAMKSENQIALESRHTSWPEYRSCMAVPEALRPEYPSCVKLMDALATARKYHIVIDSDRTQIPREMLKFMMKCPYMMKCPILKTAWDPTKPAVQHIVLDMDRINNEVIPNEMPKTYSDLAKLRMESPEYEHAVEWIHRLPITLPAINMRTPILALLSKHVISPEYAKCIINATDILTFDGHSVKPIIKDEEVLLTKDVSPSEEFAVTMKKLSDGKQILKVIIGQNTEVKIVKPSSYAAPVVYVNGTESTLSRITIPVTRIGAEIIIVHVDQKVIVRVEKHGVPIRIVILPMKVILDVSPLKFGKVSGVCGNFDGISTNDIRKPDMSYARSYPELIRSYALPRSEVPEEELRQAERLEDRARYPVRREEQREESYRPRSSIFSW